MGEEILEAPRKWNNSVGSNNFSEVSRAIFAHACFRTFFARLHRPLKNRVDPDCQRSSGFAPTLHPDYWFSGMIPMKKIGSKCWRLAEGLNEIKFRELLVSIQEQASLAGLIFSILPDRELFFSPEKAFITVSRDFLFFPHQVSEF